MNKIEILIKAKKLFSSTFIAILLLVVTPGFVLADQLSDRLDDVTASTNETDFVNAVLDLAIPIAVLCLFGLGVYSGYTMLTSQGNPEKINEAREVITNAILGFALIGLSVAVLLLIQDVLKIPGISP